MDTNKSNQNPSSSPPQPDTPSQTNPASSVTSQGVSSPETEAATFPPPDDPLTEAIEKELVSHIIENLEGSKLSVEDAQKLAQEFLALLPFQDKHDLVKKLNALSHKYDEAKAVYLKFAGPIEEEERLKKIAQMAAHIKAGNVSSAIIIAKGK